MSISEAPDALTVTQRLGERFAESEKRILSGVVVVNWREQWSGLLIIR
jgi:hypothetical protein